MIIWDQFFQKWHFVINRKNEHHHRISHTGINLDTKFPLKQTILNFWTKFTHKRVFIFSEKQKI